MGWIDERLEAALNVDELTHSKNLAKLLSLPWPEQKQDEEACFKIMIDEHPDGQIGPFIENVAYGENGDIEKIKLNGTICKLMRYFYTKYGNSSLFERFLYEHFWDKALSQRAMEN
jgi:hypothetical protein